MQTKCPTKRKDNYDSLNPTARPPRYHPFSRCFPTDFTAAFWQSSHLSVTLTHMHANDRGVSSIQWRHCIKKKKVCFNQDPGELQNSWQASEDERSRSVLLVPQSQKSQVPPCRQAIWPRKTIMGVYVRQQAPCQSLCWFLIIEE